MEELGGVPTPQLEGSKFRGSSISPQNQEVPAGLRLAPPILSAARHRQQQDVWLAYKERVPH